ncbi:hypothetical protein OHA01_26210 [Micromonospora zamorensis]|uniref:hypothetical protein n=1 Tax=Micromonospora zamorensis TaxID=709883 RepID=UPI00386A5095|nr:hypothetical protein OHA01_26210 [Micromonospora zamorensis]
MSPRVADLGDVLAHTFTTPAPTTPQPTPPPPLPPASPWQPRVTDEDTYRAFLDGLTTGDLIAEIRRGGDELAAGIARNRQLGEVA